jgi:hypothetical protein
VLRGEFGLEEEEITGDWRKLCNEDLDDLDIMKVIKWRTR